jgi:hypothetical protein
MSTTIWQIRYDNAVDDAFFAVANCETKEVAQALLRRLRDAHAAADHDDCSIGEEWGIEEITANDDLPAVTDEQIAAIFEEDPYAAGHAEVMVGKFPLGGQS